ncbi:MAG: cobalt-precorrin-5B (C(1))-methyltransferase CbiD [Tissierellia bacterium]|nr:cobalt-precorrin-5B (C(1))-methyltransferase CbiD [Tissierellia bacterium]
MERYMVKNGKKLRCGFTTGTCAAAAATAGVLMLFTGKAVENISVKLPRGEILIINIREPSFNTHGVRCCVQKDSGDDHDSTDGILIYADVNFDDSGEIHIEGGKGVGRVTQKGLDCKVGEPAINSVPRKMITENVRKICDSYGYKGGVNIVISVPEGEEVAKKTFNPQLGIVGGISIIGTTGIVEPMSEKALIDSLKVEMQVIKEKGFNTLLAFPGNYAENFIDSTLGIRGENSLKFSNYLGEILDFALELNYKEILIVGHIGKMVKVAGGMMNTHSHMGDFRMEMFACYAGLYGARRKIIAEILESVTTEQVLDILNREKLFENVIEKISERAFYYINKRVDNKIKIKLIIYSNNYGILNKQGD